MKCDRCNVEMEKRKFVNRELLFGNGHYSFSDQNGGYPVVAKSVYICPQCGRMEFNIKE